jgi:hypothetical protein
MADVPGSKLAVTVTDSFLVIPSISAVVAEALSAARATNALAASRARPSDFRLLI